MPREIKDLKEFIKIMRREKKNLPKADKITIKKNKKTSITKFKLRTPKYLITLRSTTRPKPTRSCSPFLPTSRRSRSARRTTLERDSSDLAAPSSLLNNLVPSCSLNAFKKIKGTSLDR